MDLWKIVRKFLQCNLIEYTYYKQKTKINLPEINPVGDGSVYLCWRTDNTNLLLNISKEYVSYYGETFNKKNKTSKIKNKYNIDTLWITFDLKLSKWILKNLKKE